MHKYLHISQHLIISQYPLFIGLIITSQIVLYLILIFHVLLYSPFP